jgi:hypothetical protein
MLNAEQMGKVHREFKIPCTKGGGTGICGMASAFSNNFIICLDADSSEPTDMELKQLSSYREYKVRSLYRNPDAILDMEFPADNGHNTTVFLKGPAWSCNGEQGWCYRKMTWTMGPVFVPTIGMKDAPPWNLVHLLDNIENLIPEKWQEWKLAHPDIFPVQ